LTLRRLTAREYTIENDDANKKPSGTVTPGINFKRTATATATTDHSECEGSAAIPILGQLTTTGYAAFQSALAAKLGSDWTSTVIPSNYTIAGWNTTS
jgi:sphingomyelin phosphodiesterase